MVRHRSPLVLMLAAALAITGCGDDDTTADDDAADTTTTTAPADEETTTTAAEAEAEDEPADSGAAPVRDLRVEVLDPGAEPRQELRLQVEPGAEQAFVLRQQQEMTVVAGGQTQQTATATEQDVTYTVDSVEDGVISATTTYGAGRILDDPPVDAATRDILGQLFAAFEDQTGSTTFDDRGAVLEVEAPDLRDLPAQLQGTLDLLIEGIEGQASQIAVPFPEEAVGVGARWRVSAAFELTGLPFEISTEVTLTGLDGASAQGELALRMSIVPGPVEIQGVQAEVVSGDLSGAGTIQWNLSTPVATTDQEMSGEIVMRADQGGTPLEIRQTMRQRYQITPV